MTLRSLYRHQKMGTYYAFIGTRFWGHYITHMYEGSLSAVYVSVNLGESVQITPSPLQVGEIPQLAGQMFRCSVEYGQLR